MNLKLRYIAYLVMLILPLGLDLTSDLLPSGFLTEVFKLLSSL
jgi:hypothetical protein